MAKCGELCYLLYICSMKALDIRIKKIGCYFFPFVENTFDAIATVNDDIDLAEYLEKSERACVEVDGVIHILTNKELTDKFNGTIKMQRIWYKAAILVCDKKFISINPALRSLGIKI